LTDTGKWSGDEEEGGASLSRVGLYWFVMMEFWGWEGLWWRFWDGKQHGGVWGRVVLAAFGRTERYEEFMHPRNGVWEF
jgi:hypothetical protein